MGRVTAAVCTRNRGASVLATARSILASTHPDFELLIIDQSPGSETESSLAELRLDPRLSYQRSETIGLGRARNLALATARTEVVVFTDDDCVVPPSWLEEMERLFEQHSRVAVAFCNVRAGPHDRSAGFIPSYERKGTKILRRILDKCTARGMGAGLAVRREPMLALGGFDEMLGPGAEFPACDDGDVAVRALLKGYEVCETDAVSVLHFGFRTWAEGRALTRRDWLGIGAAYSKPLRAGHLSFAVVPLYELFMKAVLPPLFDVLRLRRPQGIGRILSFMEGMARGLARPVDRKSLRFV